ncbi:MAG: hypothetical protein ABGX27_05300 [Desulfurobacteriaceae bacterium]
MKINIDHLIEMGEVKVPYELLMRRQRLAIQDAIEEGILDRIEKLFGKRVKEEVEEWWYGLRNKYHYPIPRILGETFSYVLAVQLVNVFLRYLLDRYLKEKEKKTKFVEKMEELGIIHLLLREPVWERKDGSLIQRTMSYEFLPYRLRKEGIKFVVLALRALLETPLFLGEKNLELFKEYLDKWLKKSAFFGGEKLLKETKDFLVEIAKNDFSKWFKEKFKPFVDSQGICWLGNRRKETILNARATRAKWVTPKIAEVLKLTQTEDELFPNLKEYIEKHYDPDFFKKAEESALGKSYL